MALRSARKAQHLRRRAESRNPTRTETPRGPRAGRSRRRVETTRNLARGGDSRPTRDGRAGGGRRPRDECAPVAPRMVVISQHATGMRWSYEPIPHVGVDFFGARKLKTADTCNWIEFCAFTHENSLEIMMFLEDSRFARHPAPRSSRRLAHFFHRLRHLPSASRRHPRGASARANARVHSNGALEAHDSVSARHRVLRGVSPFRACRRI